MVAVPGELRQRLEQFGQDHVLNGWDQLDDPQRQHLLDQVRQIDLELVQRLYAGRDHTPHVPPLDRIEPAPVLRPEDQGPEVRRRGEEALQHGEVAVLLVAGGQGTRLGVTHPKGMFLVGPVSDKSLFQIHAEKVLAVRRRYGKPVPFLIMTSQATHDDTVAFLEEQRHFGLAPEDVHFFRQGTMPAVDLETGKLLMEAPGRLFTSPNGHGGTLRALSDSGLLAQLQERGFRQVFYFQVDNPLVKIVDPVFLGLHLGAYAEVSSRVLPKLGPTDRLGNVVQVDGRCVIVEYSDLPEELARQTDEQGRLHFSAGSPAIHLFSVAFLARVAADREGLPFHLARKKVPCLDAHGNLTTPERENALKFEMFIFDVLPRADRWTVVETSRLEEFAPLKNAAGADSEETVRQALTDLAADWLEKAKVQVPRNPDGSPRYPLEISPLFALDAEELGVRVDRHLSIDGPTYLA